MCLGIDNDYTTATFFPTKVLKKEKMRTKHLDDKLHIILWLRHIHYCIEPTLQPLAYVTIIIHMAKANYRTAVHKQLTVGKYYGALPEQKELLLVKYSNVKIISIM